ncbi:MAG: hypothetical protein COU81_03145 [Candidatus Portnoybacteria bacterium CG10_big_fil_rev_8_21_14_0_10_36_7]|uniref:Uncharacterized protein n=1 Tax=Candidatus Portnoybacteria bacterium CG10_big_fil_rev_8_21_14_0_10_36_7 TaxID=1974812 RepID=A0A2M8KDK1_9BACT|nr:MAG: hypothetical protein COU81_03145 [Candidatus Portnoybacteria bacterium CG10_big_fil_rev_8_21_14_0_10_36_7]
MNNKFSKIVSFSAVWAIGLLAPLFVLARGLVPCGGAGEAECNACYVFVMFKNVFDFIAFTLTPPAALLMFVVGGIFYVLGGSGAGSGKEGNSLLTKAKSIFWSAVIGVVIVYTSWLIVDTIILIIGTKTANFVSQNWYTFTCQ